MKNNSINFFIVVIFLMAGIFLISHPSENFRPENIKYVKIAGQSIRVDLALTDAAKEQGLSGRNNLKENEGMLFVFDHLDKYPFWMKDMKFPIDIIWLAPSKSGDREDMEIIYIKKNAQPNSYPETYGSEKDAQYVLEIVSGFSEKNNLKEGDKIEFMY